MVAKFKIVLNISSSELYTPRNKKQKETFMYFKYIFYREKMKTFLSVYCWKLYGDISLINKWFLIIYSFIMFYILLWRFAAKVVLTHDNQPLEP